MGEIILPPIRGTSRSPIDAARTKVQRVFRYLLELHRIKAPPLIHWDHYGWRLELAKVAHHPGIRRGKTGASESEQGIVLRVGRPEETECPRPSVIFENWLKPGWEQAGVEPQVNNTRKIQTGGTGSVSEKFEDSEERVDAYEEWLALRQTWAAIEKGVVASIRLFTDLFELSGRFARESEKYQLYLADGILVAKGGGEEVRHPVLLKRVQLDFDASAPEFILRESLDPPEIYSPLLRYLGCDGRELLQIRESMGQTRPHPLEGERTSEFLKELVHRFWEDGQFFEHPDLSIAATGPYIYRQPTILLGHRNHGFAESLGRYADTLETATEIPESLMRIVGVASESGREEGEGSERTVDVLLTKDANPEQERVIHRLEETGAVLVQGPPGTGKSHTIANLIGHLLAQNKTILVTSHASKALRVVREKVAEPLQALCVSLLDSDDESSKQLEESITGIVNVLSTTNRKKIANEIEKISEKRNALQQERDELRGALLEAIAAEYLPIEVNGDSAEPTAVARMLLEGVGRHDWVPGPVGPETEPPLTAEEVAELYALNAEISKEDEAIVGAPLPDPTRLPEPRQFASLHDEVARLETTPVRIGAEYWTGEGGSSEGFAKIRAALAAVGPSLEVDDAWVLDCLEAGRGGKEARAAWLSLARSIEECVDRVTPLEELVVAHAPKFLAEGPAAARIRLCTEIIDQLQAGERLGGVTPEFRPEWETFAQEVIVDGGPPRRVVHYQAIQNLLEIQSVRDELRIRWNRQMEPLGGPNAASLGEKPEQRALPAVERIRIALRWHDEIWTPLETALSAAGFDWTRLLRDYPAEPVPFGELKRLRGIVRDKLSPLIDTRAQSLSLGENLGARQEWLEYLGTFPKNGPAAALTKLFIQGVKRKDFDSYSHAWRRLGEVIERTPAVARRAELLESLSRGAAGLADLIRARKKPHQNGAPPGDFLAAWRHRHWEQALATRHAADLDALQKKLSAIQTQLQEATASYVEKLAWAAQLERTGLPQQQALNGWLALHKKIGRGTGKNVGRLREEAQKVLSQCRQAVPVWIMPLSRVMESFDIATTRFDVVILDEASQNDVIGLVALALGKEAVVVGDHEQVSPYAVGYDADRIQSLIDEILQGIPNRQLYDGKTSVYDLARQSFGGTIRLLEHFRCVPDIIQFSNFLCYGGEIRPLRERSASALLPHIVAHRVPRGTAKDKINPCEAIEIASLVAAICKLPEYQGSSIGVISMVGTEQALHIDSILRTKLSVAEYQRRRLLCGNASQFQGDERDVIFLSMVDSAKGKPLTLRRRDDAKKVFNVAASRARDQLWVVHSLDPGRDLKPGDLRLQLISHAMDPTSLVDDVDAPEAVAASAFEQALHDDLVQAGYRTTLHFPVGDMPIDIVVEGGSGQRIAILCEGDQEEPPEDLVARMERPMVLARLGWKFNRMRASEYYLDPQKAFRNLTRRLKTAGIDPMFGQAFATPTPENSNEPTLLQTVLTKAEQIRGRWKEKDKEGAPAPVKAETLETAEPPETAEAHADAVPETPVVTAAKKPAARRKKRR